MRKKNLAKLFGVAVALGGIAAAVLIVAYSAFYGKALGKEQVVYVTPDSGYEALVEQIRPSLRSNLHRLAFDYYSSHLNLEGRLRGGYYLFAEGESVIRLVRRLVIGEQTPVRLVVGESRTLPQLAGKIASQIAADSASLLRAMRDRELRKELGFVKDSTIAMFIPNTYEVWWSISPEDFMRRIKREYDRFWSSERTAKLERCRLSKYEVMILASIVYEESKISEEMVKIAGVYLNRMRRGYPLQACPTVKYAMGRFDLQRVLHKHLIFPSPFNTYIRRGLPPAPICIPSVMAIDAVLNYSAHDYLYFCARPEMDGRHNFARTLKEHNRNSRLYSEELKRRNIK